jgi:hypothetical protein
MGARRMVVVLALVALALVSCTPTRSGGAGSSDARGSGARSRDTSSSSVPKPLRLAETSYRWIPPRTPYPFNNAIDFTYVVKNPNTGFGVAASDLRITMLDQSGRTLLTDDFEIGTIRPGETIVGGSQEFPDQQPASVQFQLLTPTGAWAPSGRWEPKDFKPLQIQHLSIHRNAGQPSASLVGYPLHNSYLTLVVQNPNAVDFPGYIVDVIHRDATGTIVAHYDDFGPRIASNTSVAVRIDVPDILPSTDEYEAFARPWYGPGDQSPIRATP